MSSHLLNIFLGVLSLIVSKVLEIRIFENLDEEIVKAFFISNCA